MQAGAIDFRVTFQSLDFAFFLQKIHPKSSVKDVITFKLKPWYDMVLTNIVRKIFFCNTQKHDGKQTSSIFLIFSFKLYNNKYVYNCCSTNSKH